VAVRLRGGRRARRRRAPEAGRAPRRRRRGRRGARGLRRAARDRAALNTTALESLAAETGFSGVVRVDEEGKTFERAFGFEDRSRELPNTVETRFALASGAKSFTALTVVTLIEDGTLERTTPARELLGADLPLIRDDVTVEHLLAHRSGIGDYLEETDDLDLNEVLLTVPAHRLETTEDYLAVLDGFETAFAPDERFAYNNGGYVVLALIAERASGVPFHELVAERVCKRAGLRDTAFLRSDELPAHTALGYVVVDGAWRTNVFHLPVRGSGDGGIYSTVADVRAFWTALFRGEIVSRDWVREMTRPRSEHGRVAYGLGFWLRGDAVLLEGMDSGVSFRSIHEPADDRTVTVISNTTDGAWPIVKLLAESRP
jgi:CubicO group peptidase (beta-lactamase class C family)